MKTFRLGKEVKELEREKARLEFEVRPLQENLRILEGQVKDQQARLKETALDKNKVDSANPKLPSVVFAFLFHSVA